MPTLDAANAKICDRYGCADLTLAGGNIVASPKQTEGEQQMLATKTIIGAIDVPQLRTSGLKNRPCKLALLWQSVEHEARRHFSILASERASGAGCARRSTHAAATK